MSALAALLVAALSARGVAQCQYDVTLIAAPICAGGGAPYQPITFPQDMSETGIVVGKYEECGFTLNNRPFMWSEQMGFVTLEIPPGFESMEAEGISPNGRYIVGWGYNSANGEYQSVLWDNGVPMVILPPSGSIRIYALSVNDDGTIVGFAQNPNTEHDMAFRTSVEDLPELEILDLPLGPRSEARDVSNDGDVVGSMGKSFAFGSRGFIHDDSGAVITIGLLPSGTSSIASAINSENVVVGGASVPKDGFPFGVGLPVFWHQYLLRQLSMPLGCTQGVANDIANNHNIVGFCNTPSGVIWIDEQPFELKQLIDDPRILTLRNAIATNNNGCVVVWGSAIRDGFQESIGALLTPAGSAPSDVNSDCITDVHDVLLLLEQWGRSDSFADVDGSGSVDVFDLFDILAGWG